MFSVTSKGPNLERLTSEMGLDKGYSIEFMERFFSGYARSRIKLWRQFYL